MNALTIWTSHIVACVFILFCFLLIVIVKRALAQKWVFALSWREVNSPLPRPFHSSKNLEKVKLHGNLALYFLRDYLSVTLRFDRTPNFPPRNLTANLRVTRESFKTTKNGLLLISKFYKLSYCCGFFFRLYFNSIFTVCKWCIHFKAKMWWNLASISSFVNINIKLNLNLFWRRDIKNGHTYFQFSY